MLRRILNRVRREIFQTPVFRIPSEFAYQAAVKKHASNLPKIAPADIAIVNALRCEGIFVTSLEALAIPSTFQLLNAAQSLLPIMLAASPSNKKEYFIRATSTQLMEYPSLFLWGLEERLLDISENYLSLPVAYHGLYFRKDLNNGIKVKSRLWHKDMEDRHSIKIIIYLKDVDDNCGPFQYIPKYLNIPKRLTSLSIQPSEYNYDYIQDKVMERVISTSEWKSCLGPSGTVIFVDTASVFHRGKVPLVSDRLSIFFDYTSKQPKNPYYCKTLFSMDQLLVLTKALSERQKESVFWRQRFLREYQRKLDETL